MKFIDQFNTIIEDKIVKSRVDFLLKSGENNKVFINYFGINYNDSDLVSVKLYFSFFNKPSVGFFEEMGISKGHVELINKYWTPSGKYDFLHQGLTFGLKCYLKNNKVQINDYFHFRSESLPLIEPKFLSLTDQDRNNYRGICLEKHDNMDEIKNYYYVTSEAAKKELLKEFCMKEVISKRIPIIEYTESNIEKKVNLIFQGSEDVKKYFDELNNIEINRLNNYFFNNYKLYFFAPGIRYNSSTKAIYYGPKEVYYQLLKIQTIKLIFPELVF